MFPPAPPFSPLRRFRILLTIFLILFFCLIYPAWNASARMDVWKKQPSTVLLEPVSKLVSHTRKFLLGRVESVRLQERLRQHAQAETAPCVRSENR